LLALVLVLAGTSPSNQYQYEKPATSTQLSS